MPLYEYECDACGARFELIRKFSDADPVCIKCGGSVHRLVSSPAFHLKGSGWYATDYAKKSGSADGAKSDGGEAKDSKDTKDAKDPKDTKEPKESKDTKESASKPSPSADSAPAAPPKAPAKTNDN